MTRADTRQPRVQVAAVAITVVLLLFAVAEAAVVFGSMSQPDVTLGLDFHIYLDRTRSWLTGDGFYLASQLSGPYPVGEGTPPAMYPPVVLYLTVPFTILPAWLWWAAPLTIIGVSLWKLRPPVWTWPLLAAILVYPRTWIVLVYGNPSVWAFAALAAGLAWGWPASWTVLKPTLLPFAVRGIRRRSWWVGAAAGLILAVPFGTLWLDYATALANARNAYGLDYLLGEWPVAVALIVAGHGASGAVQRMRTPG